MSGWLNNIKSDMYQYNNRQSSDRQKCQSVSEYILKEVIPEFTITDYGYSKYRSDDFVFISTNTRAFKIRRDYIFSYTDNGNDCLELMINKHCSEFLNLEEITAMEYTEKGEF